MDKLFEVIENDFSLLVSLSANKVAKTFERTTSVMMEQQTKDVQSPTETPPLKRAKHQSTTVLDDSYSIVNTSRASNSSDVHINELGTYTRNQSL